MVPILSPPAVRCSVFFVSLVLRNSTNFRFVHSDSSTFHFGISVQIVPTKFQLFHSNQMCHTSLLYQRLSHQHLVFLCMLHIYLHLAMDRNQTRVDSPKTRFHNPSWKYQWGPRTLDRSWALLSLVRPIRRFLESPEGLVRSRGY